MPDNSFTHATPSLRPPQSKLDQHRPSQISVLTLLLGTVAATGTFAAGLSLGDARVTTVALVLLLGVLLWTFWRDRRSSMPIFFFTLCFALFLLGRQIASLAIAEPRQYGVLETGAATAKQLNTVHLLLFVTLVSLTVGWFIARTTSTSAASTTTVKRTFDDAVRKASAAILCVALPAKMYAIWLATRAIQSEGFFDGRLAAASAPLAVRALEELFTFAVLAYLVARPRLRPALTVCGLYVIVGALTLQTLSRSEFILNVIIVVLYLYHRQVTLGERIFTVGRGIAMAAVTPLLLTAMNELAVQRGRGGHTSSGLLGSTLDFVYAQGVSIRVLIYTTELQQSLGPPRWFSLGPLIEAATNFGALITGSGRFDGQTAQRATEGFQLSHTISYAISPVDYLNGIGYGSSFVAELWSDLGPAGVIAGSVLYGILLVRAQTLLGKAFFTSFATLLLLRGAMFTPRASFVYPISELVSPASILALTILASGVALLHFGRRREHATPPPSLHD